MIIRRLLKNEIETVFQIEKEIFQPFNYPLFVLRQYYDLMSEYFLVAENEANEIVGYVLGGFNLKDQTAWILSLATKNEFKKAGIGHELTKNLVERFHKNGIKSIRLTVEPDNTSALNLYQKLGFIQLENIENYYGDHSPRLLLELNSVQD
jgi:[ribosomal protein S18]-alanine N-acetyltransferase